MELLPKQLILVGTVGFEPIQRPCSVGRLLTTLGTYFRFVDRSIY